MAKHKTENYINDRKAVNQAESEICDPVGMFIAPIARIRTGFSEKFGIPRQSGLASSTHGIIIFEKKYRKPDALRGLEGFSHLWLIWGFSANKALSDWQPTVRPPRMGGNSAMGVFATRSPFRPNPLGLSCVEIRKIEFSQEQGPLIHVNGADLMDGTPIYDIKPYVRYADSRPDAVCGYVDALEERHLDVRFAESVERALDNDALEVMREILSLDPRPAYQNDPERVYGLSYSGYNIKFTVNGDTLTVNAVDSIEN